MAHWTDEIEIPDAIWERFDVVNFVSKSKGKRRKRKRWIEVTLINERYGPYRDRWISAHKFPFDEKCGESGVDEKTLINTLVGNYDVSIR